MSTQFYNFAAQNIRPKTGVIIIPTTNQNVGKKILIRKKWILNTM